MRNALVDAGPLIALFDRSDQYHLMAVRFVEDFRGTFWSTWPVLTEVSHMLDFSTKSQQAFLEWVRRGGVQLFDLNTDHLDRLVTLTKKFDDVPMDLADASLVVAAEQTGYDEVVSIDSDFYIYRDIRDKYLRNIFL